MKLAEMGGKARPVAKTESAQTQMRAAMCFILITNTKCVWQYFYLTNKVYSVVQPANA